jgi:hypothetical protein
MKLKEAVSKGSLDTFHYSRTFYSVWFSSLPAASRFFSDEFRKIIEKTLPVKQPLSKYYHLTSFSLFERFCSEQEN